MEPVRDYDSVGCMMLLSAIVYQWWQDGCRCRRTMRELAAFLEIDTHQLQMIRPRRYYSTKRM